MRKVILKKFNKAKTFRSNEFMWCGFLWTRAVATKMCFLAAAKKHQKCSREQQPRYHWQSFSCSRKSFDRFVLSASFTFLHNSPSCKSEKMCWIWRAWVLSTFVIFQQQRKLRLKFFFRFRRLTERIEKTLGAHFSFKAQSSLKIVFCWCNTQWHFIFVLSKSEKLKHERDTNAAKCFATQKTPFVN